MEHRSTAKEAMTPQIQGCGRTVTVAVPPFPHTREPRICGQGAICEACYNRSRSTTEDKGTLKHVGNARD
jgi:hypothetical protein